MKQTGYQPIIPFSKGLRFNGGFCEWWFTPWQNIDVWPSVDPLTQYLSAEPTLVEGTTWLGPVKVPNGQLGFEEQQQLDKAGIYYKQKVSGIYPGDSGTSRVNLENIPYNQFAVVGKMRAGGLFLLLGNEEYGLSFLHNYKSDLGAKGTAGSDFVFGYDSIFKAAVLPAFLGINVTPPDDGCGGGDTDNGFQNQTEIIVFEDESEKTFEWTDARKKKFGIYPLIEVWINDTATGGNLNLVNVPIYVDAFPPDTTLFTVNLTGISTGIIVIK